MTTQPTADGLAGAITSSQRIYEVRPRKDHHGVDLISDALPFWEFAAQIWKLCRLYCASRVIQSFPKEKRNKICKKQKSLTRFGLPN